MKKVDFNLVIYVAIGILIGIVLYPHIQKNEPISETLLQRVDRSMSDKEGEVIEIEKIPGTNMSVIRVLFEFDQPQNGLILDRVGAIVSNDDGIVLGSKVRLVDIAHFNTQKYSPLWERVLKVSDFEPIERE